MLFAFGAFVGFESAALLRRGVARPPRRSIPLATYTALILITLFYGFTTWTAVGGIGASKRACLRWHPTRQYFLRAQRSIREFGDDDRDVALLCTSLFASLIALHNAGSRYTVRTPAGAARLLPSVVGPAAPSPRLAVAGPRGRRAGRS